MRYVLHELVHAIQHALGKNKESDKDRDYLDRHDELEAFQYQLMFDKENLNKSDLDEYLNNLLEHHDVPRSEKKEKISELLARASAKELY